MEILDAAPPAGSPVEPEIPSWTTLTDVEVVERLPRLAVVAEQVDDALRAWVAEARRRGVSWAQIGTALAVSRQAVWDRFAHDR